MNNNIKKLPNLIASEIETFGELIEHLQQCRGLVCGWIDSDNEVFIHDINVSPIERVWLAAQIHQKALVEEANDDE